MPDVYEGLYYAIQTAIHSGWSVHTFISESSAAWNSVLSDEKNEAAKVFDKVLKAL